MRNPAYYKVIEDALLSDPVSQQVLQEIEKGYAERGIEPSKARQTIIYLMILRASARTREELVHAMGVSNEFGLSGESLVTLQRSELGQYVRSKRGDTANASIETE